MTNLVLAITIATNTQTVRLTACNVTNTRIYSIWQNGDLLIPYTNWNRNVIFIGNDNGTNDFYAHNIPTNRYYLLVDEGEKY